MDIKAMMVEVAENDSFVMARIAKGNFEGAARLMNYRSGYPLIGCRSAINQISGSELWTPVQ